MGDTGRWEFCKKVSACDFLIGSMIQRLKDTGQWDSTYIFFTSDNGGYQYTDLSRMVDLGMDEGNVTFFGVSPAYCGYGSNWPYRGGKGDFWEGSLRVPTVLSGGALPEELKGTT